jgi:hypothetical protein
MKVVSFDLIHDGEKWIAKNDDITASGKTLDELDENIKTELKAKFREGTKVKVTMELDYRTIPTWIRQYHPYYFYRTIYVDL